MFYFKTINVFSENTSFLLPISFIYLTVSTFKIEHLDQMFTKFMVKYAWVLSIQQVYIHKHDQLMFYKFINEHGSWYLKY